MTTINSVDDLLRLLDENEEFLAAVRHKILTEELIRLPLEFDEFKKDTEKKFDRIDRRFDRVDRRLDSLRGYALEDAMASRLRQRVGRLLNLKRVRVIWQARRPVQPLRRSENFHDSLEAALNDGRISDSEYTRIEDTDLVVTALRNSDDSRVYIPVEASGTINDDDISCARHSAGILSNMYNEDAIPAVYGYTIEAPQIDLARAKPEEGKAEVYILLEDDNF